MKESDSDLDHLTHGIKSFFDFPADEYDSEVFRWEEHHLKPGYARPVVIHRAVLGSVERFYSILCEHIGGKWPFWISPRQCIILPISEKFKEYANKINLFLKHAGFNSEVDSSDNTMKKKILFAEMN